MKPNYFEIFLDHCQIMLLPYDTQWHERALSRAQRFADKYGCEHGAHRVRVQDMRGVIVYMPEGVQP
jgi:hypothetical protein